MTILLLEDQGIIAIDLVEALEERGYDVKAFTSLSGTKTWLNQHHPAAAIVDCELSDGDCSHLVRQLRQGGVPIIVYTGRHPKDLSSDFIGLDIFPKPTSTQELMDAILQKLKDDPARPNQSIG